jgi:hypothetical protein
VRFKYNGAPGAYDLHVRYFDEDDGISQFKLYIADRLIDEWRADNRLPTPTTLPDAHSSMRRTVRSVTLVSGDRIRIEGIANQGERAGIDYIEIAPSRPAQGSTR